MPETLENNNKKGVIIRLSIFCALCIVCVIGICLSNTLEPYINFDYFAYSVAESKYSKVHFIDVGQGDCTVIELPTGEIAMIDTGPEGEWNKINTYFKFLKIPKKIDYLILTHTDSDHIGNTLEILQNYEVKKVYIPKVYSNYEVTNNLIENDNYKIYNNPLWNNICREIRTKFNAENIIYNEEGVQICDEGNLFELTFFSPYENFYSDDNSYSPIILCQILNYQMLFMGDSSTSMEKQFLNKISEEGLVLNITVLKVGHHGSKTSSSSEFIESISPKYAVISCGKDNLYAHPANETINVLVQNNVKVLRTDVSNSVMFYCDEPTATISHWGMFSDYENFNYFYVKTLHISLTCFILAFVTLVLPMLISKKNKTPKK